MNNKTGKIIALNLIIALLLVICFSDGLLGLGVSGHGIIIQALSVTIIVMCIIAFIYGNYSLLFKKKEIIKAEEIKTPEQFLTALEECSEKKTFRHDMDTLASQIMSFRKKRSTITDILLQSFSAEEMTYQQFQKVIGEGETLFFANIRSIINRLNAFDEEDYLKQRIRTGVQENDIASAKMQIYNEYIDFVKKGIEANERVLLKLDMLLSEASKLGSMEAEQIKDSEAMKQIDEMINNIKWYK